mgnify:CR=1 FL=1
MSYLNLGLHKYYRAFLTIFFGQLFFAIFFVKLKLLTAKKCKPLDFHEFFDQIFSQFFLSNQSCLQLKTANPLCFHEFLTFSIFLLFSRPQIRYFRMLIDT